MSEHLPECVPDFCVCPELRACEARVREEERFRCLTMSENRSRWREEGVAAGYEAGLRAAREAIAALPMMKIAGNFPLYDADEVIAAIDALREEPNE